MKRWILLPLVVVAAVAAYASRASVRLEIFPTVSVADARSTVTVTAEIRDANGKRVPNGTQVIFNTTLGQFRETVVTTENGFARGILKAGGIPGSAKVTVTVPAFSTVGTTDFEFLSDRSLLASAKEYIEIVAPSDLRFSLDNNLLGASGPGKTVKLRYREVEIEADDIQLDISAYTVRARKATLHINKKDYEFGELSFRLNTRKGFGTAVVPADVISSIELAGFMPMIRTEKRDRLSLVQVTSSGITAATEPFPAEGFLFMDPSESITQISAKKAIVFPRKLIQFQKAEVYVGPTRVMQIPLYQVNLNGNSQMFTEQIVNVADNQLSVNYPYYLSMRPGETSLLRFRLGGNAGRGFSATGGAFVDYELRWNRGDEFDGGLTFSGIGRNDWNLGLRQSIQIDPHTNAFAQLDMPAGRYLYGNGSISRQFTGFQVNLSGNASRSLRGLNYEDQRLSLSLDTDGSKIRNLPVTMYYGIGLTSNKTRYDLQNRQDVTRNYRDLALTTRAQLNSITIDSDTNLNASISTNVRPHRKDRAVGLLGSVTVARQLGTGANLNLTYDYVDDLFDGGFLGRHRLSFQGFLGSGRTSFSIFGTKSLDADRLSLNGDFSYQVSGLWRLSSIYTFDKFLGDTVLDYGLGIAYRLGWREVGLTWSKRTGRLGIQVLGTSFN